MTSAWENMNNSNMNKGINNGKPTIAICIPYKGSWEPEWIENIYTKIRHVPVDWCNKLTFLCKVPSLPVARDILVTEALKANADYILFLDDDHVLEQPADPNQALKTLYDCINKDDTKDGKMVSALYRAKQKQGFNYAMWMKYQDKGFIPIKEWTGNWLTVDVAGMGFCLIDLKIFKEVKKPYFYWETADDISEDFYFFMKAKECGYNLHVMTDVKLSHIGKLKVKIDGTITTPDL